MKMKLDILIYIVIIMTVWDFSIHIIDWRKASSKFIQSKSFFSYYYPHFWGKHPQAPEEIGRRRYDYFWMSYWGSATLLLLLYLFLK